MKLLQHLLLMAVLLSASFPLFSQTTTRDYASNVTIARDKWGVPHIYGKTDPDVAYGLAWAHAEDDFGALQEVVWPAKGLMGKALGKNGAAIETGSPLCQWILPSRNRAAQISGAIRGNWLHKN